MDELVLLARIRKICLRFPEVRETVKWGPPTFEAGKKMFAVLDHYDGRPVRYLGCFLNRGSDLPG